MTGELSRKARQNVDLSGKGLAKLVFADIRSVAGHPAAADRALGAVDEAGRVLGDAAARTSHDEDIGVVRPGEGLEPPNAGPTGPNVTLGKRYTLTVQVWHPAEPGT